MTDDLMIPGGFVGVDPGRSSGAIAYVVDHTAWAWPVSKLTDRDIWDVFSKLKDLNVRSAVLEKVHARPGQGVSSMFKFGSSFGELKMGLVASGIRFTQVMPAAWQKELSCRTGGDKNITKTRAQELFPDMKITHAIADALLIAEFARRMNK
jgi:crossover junction endodeoxyribonuclease RuvC